MTTKRLKREDLWDNDPYTVPADEKNLAQHRAKDKAKFGKLIPANRRAQKETKPAK
jgi:hypothetical protein